MHLNVNFAAQFLAALDNLAYHYTPQTVLDAFTFHDYTGYGLDPKLQSKILSRQWQDAYWEQASPVVEVARAKMLSNYGSGQPASGVWVGETSAAWHSGQCGVTDR